MLCSFVRGFEEFQMTSRSTWYLATALFISACGGSPSAPSDAASGGGVTIFEHPKFKGVSQVLLTDVEDLDDVPGCSKGGPYVFTFNFDDCISSIRVPPGWRVTVYEDPRYRGASVTFTSDVPDLDDVRGPCGDDFDDCISSIRVSRQ
jgi:peptidase inhibitor family I36